MDVIALPPPLYATGLPPLGCLYTYSLPLRLRPASTPMACLYAYGLPSYHPHHITIIIVIVIVHFLFKRNVYLSLLCDLYFF
jgi:hypothetical protein